MTRRQQVRMEFDALSIEGGLLPAEWLTKVAAIDAPLQDRTEYGVLRGLQLRDEIGRYWRIAQAIWGEFSTARAGAGASNAAVAERFVRQFAADVLGFSELVAPGVRTFDDRRFAVSLEALGGRVPFFVAPASEGLDDSTPRHGDATRRRSAFGALQEYLNAADGALWGIATNGLQLRLARDNASLTRPAWIQADLGRIFTEERYADFAALWLLLHVSRFGRTNALANESPLERWRDECQIRGSRAREALRGGVEAALLDLGRGFLAHPDNGALRTALADGSLSREGYFTELLRCVYRVIFLLTVEEREILFRPGATDAAQRLYHDGYGLRRLRERAVRRTQYDRHGDLWESLRPTFAGLGRPAGQPALGLPGLGGLFADEQCPHLDGAALENRALLSAVFRLAWIRESGALGRVNWRDMGPEELGSVYESLLELVPLITADGTQFSFAGASESAGNARKLTGSYYTPDALVQQLLDTALEPVISARLAANPAPADAERALLTLTIIDPACGSGHFLLAAARRMAVHLARLRAGGTPSAAEYRSALRDVVTHCIYGVDRNPMALELARMALWLEAYTPDRALGFLDHHLVCGDALLGLLDLEVMRSGIPDKAYTEVLGDDKEVVKTLAKLNSAARRDLDAKQRLGQLTLSLGTTRLADAFTELESLSDDAVEGVAAKRHRWAALRSEADTSGVALAADIFLAAFLVPKRVPDGGRVITEQQAAGTFPTTGALSMAMEGTLSPSHAVAVTARAACREARVLHWPLAFPQVFARGGFDVVLGNPPWETMSPDRREFYAQYIPGISEMPPALQEAAVNELLEDSRVQAAWNAYARDLYVAVAFIKHSGRYTRFAKGNLGKGDFNVYRQFVELALDACAPLGMAAQIVPENFYNGANAAGIRQSMFDSYKVESILSFENHRGVWFPGIDTRMKFAIYVARRGEGTTSFPAAFSLRDPSQLQAARATMLDVRVALLREFSPEALTIMEFSNQFEIDVCARLYSTFPHFGTNVAGLPSRQYMAEVHMGNDSALFGRREDGIPVFQGSMVTHFDYRAKGYLSGHGRNTVWREFPFGDPDKAIVPQWYIDTDRIPAKCTYRIQGYRIGFCDVGNATNQRALMAALIPPNTICGHKVPTITMDGASHADVMLWLGAANSLVMDFLVRMKVALTMSLSLMDSLPLPRAVQGDPRRRAVAALAARLCLAGPEMSKFHHGLVQEASLLGECIDPCVEPMQRALLEAELNARVARDLFGVSRSELLYVMDPRDALGENTAVETFRSLRDTELREHGEYRTRRLVLEAWDRLYGT